MSYSTAPLSFVFTLKQMKAQLEYITTRKTGHLHLEESKTVYGVSFSDLVELKEFPEYVPALRKEIERVEASLYTGGYVECPAGYGAKGDDDDTKLYTDVELKQIMTKKAEAQKPHIDVAKIRLKKAIRAAIDKLDTATFPINVEVELTSAVEITAWREIEEDVKRDRTWRAYLMFVDTSSKEGPPQRNDPPPSTGRGLLTIYGHSEPQYNPQYNQYGTGVCYQLPHRQ